MVSRASRTTQDWAEVRANFASLTEQEDSKCIDASQNGDSDAVAGDAEGSGGKSSDVVERFRETWETFDAFQSIERTDPLAGADVLGSLQHLSCCPTEGAATALGELAAHLHAGYANSAELNATPSLVLLQQANALKRPLQQQVTVLSNRVAALKQLAELKTREAQLTNELKTERKLAQQVLWMCGCVCVCVCVCVCMCVCVCACVCI